MDRFQALSTFVAVAELQGFAKAARHLNMSPPAVTRVISGLEGHLGTQLFQRTTRSVTLTEDGTAFLERAREILQQLDEAEHYVMGSQSTPRGELHVTAPVMFGRLHVLPVIMELLAHYRDLSTRLMLLDRNIRLVDEGVDVAVRIGDLPDSGLISVIVGSVRQVIVASPDYCGRRGRPARPQDLTGHDIILGENIRTSAQWRFGPKGHQTVLVKPRLSVNSVDAVLSAAVAGVGIANVLSYQAVARIEAGQLLVMLEEFSLPPIPVHILFQANRTRVASVRLFVDMMRSRAKKGVWR
jgi:DNA-binding transcriptional LysR family regulator